MECLSAESVSGIDRKWESTLIVDQPDDFDLEMESMKTLPPLERDGESEPDDVVRGHGDVGCGDFDGDGDHRVSALRDFAMMMAVDTDKDTDSDHIDGAQESERMILEKEDLPILALCKQLKEERFAVKYHGALDRVKAAESEKRQRVRERAEAERASRDHCPLGVEAAEHGVDGVVGGGGRSEDGDGEGADDDAVCLDSEDDDEADSDSNDGAAADPDPIPDGEDQEIQNNDRIDSKIRCSTFYDNLPRFDAPNLQSMSRGVDRRDTVPAVTDCDGVNAVNAAMDRGYHGETEYGDHGRTGYHGLRRTEYGLTAMPMPTEYGQHRLSDRCPGLRDIDDHDHAHYGPPGASCIASPPLLSAHSESTSLERMRWENPFGAAAGKRRGIGMEHREWIRSRRRSVSSWSYSECAFLRRSESPLFGMSLVLRESAF